MLISDIRHAIRQERNSTPKFTDFEVLEVMPDRRYLQLILQMRDHAGVPVDVEDYFDGSSAWWRTGALEGSAKVVHVDTDTGMVTFQNLNGVLPRTKDVVRLTPLDFLRPLARCWDDDAWAQMAIAHLADFEEPKQLPNLPLSSAGVPGLRSAQRQAFDLVTMEPSFIWGPPGTGKTTVLGVLLATYLRDHPRARVLVLCTTNKAVDEVLLSVDHALDTFGQWALRQCLQRQGEGYDRGRFQNRQHLLPGFSGYLDEGGIKAPAGPARLVAITIARALATLTVLRSDAPFDFIVMDEASQVSVAHVLALMPLAKSHLFAGDPMQLSPVVKSTSESALRWMAESVFAYKPESGASVCLLNEQSRMAPPICDVISETFYDGQLQVAQDALNNAAWLHHRKRKFGEIPAHEHVSILKVDRSAPRSKHHRKIQRLASAQRIVSLVLTSLGHQHVRQPDIVVITPFRQQTRLIRRLLHVENIKSVKVNTVHSSQGIQALVVIFDPVDGMNDFLLRANGKRLINVALSRAEAKLIMTLSEQDLCNPMFAKMHEIVQRHATRPAQLVEQVLAEPDFHTSAIGKRVTINDQIGEIIRFSSNGEAMWVVMEDTGSQSILNTRDFMPGLGY